MHVVHGPCRPVQRSKTCLQLNATGARGSETFPLQLAPAPLHTALLHRFHAALSDLSTAPPIDVFIPQVSLTDETELLEEVVFFFFPCQPVALSLEDSQLLPSTELLNNKSKRKKKKPTTKPQPSFHCTTLIF